MTFPKIILRVLLAFVGTLIASMVAGILVPIKPFPAPHFLEWMLLSNLVSVAALSIVAVRVEWRGWKMGAAIAAIPLTLAAINLLEGAVFLKNSPMEFGRIFVFTLVSSALVVPMWMLLFGRRDEVATKHYHPIHAQSRGELVWKFLLCDVTYLILYYGIGLIIFPYVKDFYATQTLPSLGTIAALQLLVRGPLFILFCVAVTRMLGMPRLSGALMVGLVFTLLSGLAPLLMPNPYFPDSVRWVHLCEVTSENFVFGAIVAWLWGQSTLAQPLALRHAA
jgi:hypothetical protein